LTVFQRISCLTITLGFAATASAATMFTTTGNLTLTIENNSVVFLPEPMPNLAITAPFETAMAGDTINGVIDAFNFATLPTDFETGRYVITLGLRPAPPSNISLTFHDPDTFDASSFVSLLATFNFVAANACGTSCGDVLGEFGSLPGIENCVGTGAVTTCVVASAITLTGNFVSGPQGLTELSDVEVAAVPEPSSLLLIVSGAAVLLLRKRF
jgi:hypothetical protein